MQPGPTAEDFGGQTLENGAGIRFQGWKIEKSEGAIASSGAIRELKVRLQEGASTVEQLPRLPEAIFLNNKLSMVHEASGHKVTFDAEGALLQWLNNSLVNGSGGLTIPAASLGSWKEKLDKQAQHAGDTTGRRDWDWTYATDYCGVAKDSSDGALAWSPHTGTGVDMQLLRKREPILFFADLPLYEDDLHDNGASVCRCRIRVMPSCLFVLLRHWLRIDGTLIRQHDARYFVRFASGRPPPGAGPVAVGSTAAAANVLIRHTRLGSAPLPPLPKAPPEDDGRLVDGGDVDTPRPPFAAPPSILPDEQASAEKLAALPAEAEKVDEVPLAPAPAAAATAAGDTGAGAAAIS